MTNLTSRRIGKITLDVTEQEAHKSILRLTKNPIESGANIADHAILEPKQLTIKGKIVAYEPPKNTKIDEYLELTKKNLPRVKPAYKLTQRALKLKAEVEHMQNTINKYSKVIFDKEINVLNIPKRQIAPFLPSFVSQKMDNSSKGDRLVELISVLFEIQRSAEPLEVQTGTRLYKNMIITNIEIVTEQDLYADVTLNLEEIFIVQTQTTNGLKVYTKNMGKTTPKKEKSSLLKDMF